MIRELRTIVKQPKSKVSYSPQAKEVIYYANLMDLGVTINFCDLPGDLLYHISYFGSLRKAKEENLRFEALFKGLISIVKSIFKK